MTIQQMQSRFEAYNKETLVFIMHEWPFMSIQARDAKQAEIDARHSYKHGWIIVDGQSFNQETAFPDREFINVWD